METKTKDMNETYKKKAKKKNLDSIDLTNMSKEDLIEKIKQLEAHNLQLKNILQKKCNEEENFTEEKLTKKFDFTSIQKRHVFLKLYYLGWDSQGFVVQDDTSNTIEYHLFKALEKCCLIENRESSNYQRCGRTDKGVSAFCQVISIDLRSKLPEPNPGNCHEELKYCTMLNRLLPEHIRCYAWTHVDSNAGARFDCSSRTYYYFFPKGDLNILAMKEGAKNLVGNHDFRNLCKMDVGNGVTEFRRTILFCDIEPCNSHSVKPGFDMYRLIIKGNAFLWHQIRCIMSVLFLIGQGKETPEVIVQLLDITTNPKKPQYSMANFVPLNLFDCCYENTVLEWVVDGNEITQIIKLIQKQWAFNAVKKAMLQEMISELSKIGKEQESIFSQAEAFMDGVKPKVYKPLLSRMKCESLERKIGHYVKRRKLVAQDHDG